MSNVLAEEKRQQVLALGRLGWSLRGIERATGVRRETASGYLKAAGVVVRGRGRPPARPAKPAITSEVSTDPAPTPAADTGAGDATPATEDEPSRAPQASACEPYRDFIVDALGRRRNAMAIWQDLVDDHGFPAGYASVRRFVSTLRQQPAVEARVVITSAAGEEAQVDYGDGPMVRNADSGKYRRTRLFVLTLGYSRKSVRFLVPRSSARVWAELHERAFRRLGGSPSVVIVDNLKEGVLTPDVYDPKLNPLYRDVLAHYGVVALPCRVRDPDRKGAPPSPGGLPPHRRPGPTRPHPAEDPRPARRRQARRPRHLRRLRPHPPTRRTPRRPSHPRRARPRQEARSRRRRTGRYRRPRMRLPHLSLRPPLPRPPARAAPLAASGRPPHPRTDRLPRSHRSQNRRLVVNLVELDQALRKLRLSGMADVLEARLQQAQVEQMVPIDLVAALVSDELLRRQDRLLERRHKQARFRDPDRSLDSFDFAFNKKIDRALVFELATARFVAQREDALLIGPPSRVS